MAKKSGKNSRAARQAAYESALEPESKTLDNLPRPEKTDLTNIFIRTAAKNEALLEAKISKKKKTRGKTKINKKLLEEKLIQSANLLEKEKLERALNISNRLDGKISKSISRAKYVQTARKQGWEAINSSIRKELNPIAVVDTSAKSDSNSEMKDSEIVSEMSGDMKVETYGDVEGWDEEDKRKRTKEEIKLSNMFDLLPNVEDE